MIYYAVQQHIFCTVFYVITSILKNKEIEVLTSLNLLEKCTYILGNVCLLVSIDIDRFGISFMLTEKNR